MTDTKYFIDYGKLWSFEIEQDEYAESPRDFCDHVGVMAVFWSRYRLGDYRETDGYNGREYIKKLIDKRMPEKDYNRESEDVDYLLSILDEDDDFIYLYLYIYEHSGLAISTGSFGDPWDSGCAGFIWTDKSRYDEYCGKSGDWKEEAVKILEYEVEEFDNYLHGDVYATHCVEYDLESEDFDGEDEWLGGYYSGKWGEALIDELYGYTTSAKRYDDFDEALADYRNWLSV